MVCEKVLYQFIIEVGANADATAKYNLFRNLCKLGVTEACKGVESARKDSSRSDADWRKAQKLLERCLIKHSIKV